MSNAVEKNQDLEILKRALPDFQGYQCPEKVKESDQIFRQYAIARLQRYRCVLAILRAVLNKTLYRMEQSKLEDLSRTMEALIKFLGKEDLYIKNGESQADQTTHSPVEIYKLDLKLLNQLGTLDAMLKDLEESIKAKGDTGEKIRQISVLLDDFQHGLQARSILIQKINGNYWVLDLWL